MITSIDKEHVIRAKSRVATWFDIAQQPLSVRPKLLRAVELVARELPNRSDWYETRAVRLDDSADLPIHINAPQYRAFPCRKSLVTVTIVPQWRVGWGTILKDEDVYQILSWFLHYACQYVHRSYVANMLMTIWESHERVLHPFGSSAMYKVYGPLIPMPSSEEALDLATQTAIKEWGDDNQTIQGAPIATAWTVRNTLDPFLHQAVFHFLRAQNLTSESFDLEAVVAFDCVVQTVAAFIQSRSGLAVQPARSEICARLGLNMEFVELAEYMYFLRNNFGAHAGGWRWWDQAEMLADDTLADISQFTHQVLSAAADFEPRARAVSPSPAEWGGWLFHNFEMLWDAVWFDELDRWNLTERSGR